jgi:hypothetical protein
MSAIIYKLPITPTCINYGCNQPVTYSHKDTQGNKRWRIHCPHCQKASYGKWPHRDGVTPYKTGLCSNQDGHLGFKCGIDYAAAPHFIGMTEVDHKNGNHTDNRHENLDELCKLCHLLKSRMNGDLKRNRYKQA